MTYFRINKSQYKIAVLRCRNKKTNQNGYIIASGEVDVGRSKENGFGDFMRCLPHVKNRNPDVVIASNKPIIKTVYVDGYNSAQKHRKRISDHNNGKFLNENQKNNVLRYFKSSKHYDLTDSWNVAKNWKSNRNNF